MKDLCHQLRWDYQDLKLNNVNVIIGTTACSKMQNLDLLMEESMV